MKKRAVVCLTLVALAVALLTAPPVAAAVTLAPRWGCYTVSLPMPGITKATLSFADGSTTTYREVFTEKDADTKSQNLGGRDGQYGKLLRSVTYTVNGATTTVTNPNRCDGTGNTTTIDGVTVSFPDCTRVEATGAALTKLVVSGFANAGDFAQDTVAASGGGTSKLEASLSAAKIQNVYVSTADKRFVVTQNINPACVPPESTIAPDTNDDGATAYVLSQTCFDGGMRIRNGYFTAANVEFSDGSSTPFTFAERVTEFSAPAPENTTPTKTILTGRATGKNAGYDFTNEEFKTALSCRSVDGSVTVLNPDTVQLDPATGGVVDVLANDEPATGAKLRPDTLAVTGDGASVRDGKVVVEPFRDTVTLTYKVCDSFNFCQSATMTVTKTKATLTLPAVLGGGALVLLIVVPFLWFFFLKRRKRRADAEQEAEDAGEL